MWSEEPSRGLADAARRIGRHAMRLAESLDGPPPLAVGRIHTPAPLEAWLTKAQAAAHLGVTTRTINRWQHEGLPHHPVRGVNRYRRSELDAWVEDAEGYRSA